MALIKISNKNIDFKNIFFSKLVVKLSKYTNINNHIIK